MDMRDRHPSPEHLSMLFGHRQISDCYPMDSLSQIIDVEHFRERTPADIPVFQDMIRARMKACRSKDGLALACGPMPFLRMIWEYALEIGLRTQLSLEQRMACGVGACLGCVTRTSMHWADAEKAGLPYRPVPAAGLLGGRYRPQSGSMIRWIWKSSCIRRGMTACVR